MRALLLGLLIMSFGQVGAVDRKAVNAAIERGVAALKRAQNDDGSWHNTTLGATALAGLTLLECDVPRTDPSVKKAAEYVRKHGLTSTHVYSLSLSILFLDRLGYSNDTPLIESMIVRLLAGQKRGGAWSYDTPNLSDLEIKRIQGEMDGSRVLRAGGDLKKLPERGKRTVKDLPDSVRDQLSAIERNFQAPGPAGIMAFGGGDNSNTQFAVLALWTGRRYGVPTQQALVRAYEYFRRSQNPADGGWGYVAAPPGFPAVGGSTATMTCAGVLALAVGQGSHAELKKRDSADVSKDAGLKAGLQLLGVNIGNPLGWDGLGPKPAAVPSAGGKSYYFLWSLERICVALNLATIGKKDWYNWGAEILLANQAADGTWSGEYAMYHADTCFALLFLKRSNLAADLGDKIIGLKDPGDRRLKAGGEFARPGVKDPPVTGGIERPGKEAKPGEQPQPPNRQPEDRVALELPSRTPQEREARDLAVDLVKTKSPERRGEIIQKLRDSKGVTYTEALVAAIYGLEGEAKRAARQALTARLTRMKDTTLADYLLDEEPEIRRAAALASGTKQITTHINIL
ncbi:MAG: hypothetical protein SNJ82_13450, partial [Gemmataceae bacterium]